MTVDPNSIDLPAFMAEHLQRAEPDLLRSDVVHVRAGVDVGRGRRDLRRRRTASARRSGPTPATATGPGTSTPAPARMEVAIPKLREGSYFPDWLLERRRRAERALTTVVATCYLLGVSTRRMEKLVETLGITRLSKSQVSVMATRARRPRRGLPDPAPGRRARTRSWPRTR